MNSAPVGDDDQLEMDVNSVSYEAEAMFSPALFSAMDVRSMEESRRFEDSKVDMRSFAESAVEDYNAAQAVRELPSNEAEIRETPEKQARPRSWRVTKWQDEKSALSNMLNRVNISSTSPKKGGNPFSLSPAKRKVIGGAVKSNFGARVSSADRVDAMADIAMWRNRQTATISIELAGDLSHRFHGADARLVAEQPKKLSSCVSLSVHTTASARSVHTIS